MLKELIYYKWDSLYLFALLATVKAFCGMFKVSTHSDSFASFTVTMLASVSSGSNLGQKQLLFFLAMEKSRYSSALKWGIVKISLTTFQRLGKRRAFSAWSFISQIKPQTESNFKSPQLVFQDSITWSGVSLSRSSWYLLNSSTKENNADILLVSWLKLSRGTQ